MIMSNKKLYQAGFVAAIVSTLGWLAFIMGTTGLPDLSGIDDPSTLFLALKDARTSYLLYGWGGVIGAFLTIPYVLAVYYATRQAGSIRLLAMMAGVIGAVLAAMAFMGDTLTQVYFYVPAAQEASIDQLPMLAVVARFSGDVFEVAWFVGSFLVYGLGIGLLAFYAWQTGVGSKWINGIGLIAGVTGLIWLRPFLPFLNPATTILSLLNILTVTIWAIGISASLVRHKET
jgi:hypothetical protein